VFVFDQALRGARAAPPPPSDRRDGVAVVTFPLAHRLDAPPYAGGDVEPWCHDVRQAAVDAYGRAWPLE